MGRIRIYTPEERKERARAAARAYYWANREAVLDRAAVRRGGSRRTAAVPPLCANCGGSLTTPAVGACIPNTP